MKTTEPSRRIPSVVIENIDAVNDFYATQEGKLSRPRSVIERITDFAGQPIYFGCIVVFVAAWTLTNIFAERLGWAQFDAPPFAWLQAVISLFSLIVGTAVLIKQSRMSRISEQHAHLDLQVNLLTEQKATKIIQLLEELRRDLPIVADRRDEEVEDMKKPTDPHAMLHALQQKSGIAHEDSE